MIWPAFRASPVEEPARLAELLGGVSRSLELRASAMADSLLKGNHPSSIPGRGIEVTGVREYQPGDEARGIDWRVTARRGRLYVREFSEEKELPVLVVLDRNPTLWSGRGGVKALRAMESCALLSALGLQSGDTVGLVLSNPDGGQIIPPGKGRNQLSRTIKELLSIGASPTAQGLGPSLHRARFLLNQRARIFIVGDYQIHSGEFPGIRSGMGSLMDRHLVIPVRISDRKEGELPGGGVFPLEDPTTGKRGFSRGRFSHKRLQDVLTETRKSVSALFRELGLAAWELDVGDPLQEGFRRHLYRPRHRAGPGTTAVLKRRGGVHG